MEKLKSEYLKKKWVKVLDMDIGSPIKTVEEASKVAILLESKVTLNEGWNHQNDTQNTIDTSK